MGIKQGSQREGSGSAPLRWGSGRCLPLAQLLVWTRLGSRGVQVTFMFLVFNRVLNIPVL